MPKGGCFIGGGRLNLECGGAVCLVAEAQKLLVLYLLWWGGIEYTFEVRDSIDGEGGLTSNVYTVCTCATIKAA